MDKKFKQQLGLIAFGVALFTALNNLNYISDFLHVCAELLTPVFAGLLMAFILSVPMRGIGKRLSRLIAKLSHYTYAKFLSGQCVEVLILGTLIFLSFSIFRIPYAGLTAVLTAAFAFVPYIGAFLSCAIGMLLTLLAEPNKVILCLIVYQAAQFVENQFIYPHVVGSSVGLSPFWTLLAVLLGGKMFGVLGIIFFIPLMAVISQLLHENIEHRLAVRKLKKNDLIQKSD